MTWKSRLGLPKPRAPFLLSPLPPPKASCLIRGQVSKQGEPQKVAVPFKCPSNPNKECTLIKTPHSLRPSRKTEGEAKAPAPHFFEVFVRAHGASWVPAQTRKRLPTEFRGKPTACWTFLRWVCTQNGVFLLVSFKKGHPQQKAQPNGNWAVHL